MRPLVVALILPLMLLGGCGDTAGDDRSAGQPAAASAPPRPESATEPDPLPPAKTTQGEPRIEIAPRSAETASPTPRPQDILPLAAILAVAQKRVSGEVIDVDLDDDDGAFHYEVKILTHEGRKIEMQIDARSGQILKLEED